MVKVKQDAVQSPKSTSKLSDVAKTAEGLWAALLQGSASAKVEQAAVLSGFAL
jgi:hypothetical protein